MARWGRIDALVNNAGISVFGKAAEWDALDADTFQRILGISTLGSFQPAVRVNAVCPGLVTSRWFVEGTGREGYEAAFQAHEAGVPLQRACTPEDVAEAIVWLVDGAKTVTGELVMLDSGMHLGGIAPARRRAPAVGGGS